jgi:hypothetical protein
MDPALFQAACASIEAAHAADPAHPAEQRYAERLVDALRELVPDAPPLLLLAGRCQHLERWVIPRSAYPMDRPGYHAWRRAVHARQGERATVLLREAGIPEADALLVGTWVAKQAPRSAQGQALEDAACLVFFRHEVPAFAATHPEYDDARYVTIIQKTWKKLSPRGQALVAAIPFPPPWDERVRRALAG